MRSSSHREYVDRGRRRAACCAPTGTAIAMDVLRIILLMVVLANIAVAQMAPSIQWQRSLGGSGLDRPYGVIQMSDSGDIVGGITYSNDGDVTNNHSKGDADYWAVKLDTRGNVLWKKCYGGTSVDILRSIRRTKDGGFIMAGYTSSNDSDVHDRIGTSGAYELWIVKCDNAGVIQWSHCYGDGRYHCYDRCIRQTSDGGYVIAGYTMIQRGVFPSATFSNDFLVVKIDSLGKQQWMKTFGGSDEDKAYDIIQTPDHGYYVVGSSGSKDGDVTYNPRQTGPGPDFWIIKIDSAGTMQQDESYGGTGEDIAQCIQVTPDGGYIITGFSNSTDGDRVLATYGRNTWVFRTSVLDHVVWQNNRIAGSPSWESNGDDAQSLELSPDGGFIIASGGSGISKIDANGYVEWETSPLAYGTFQPVTSAIPTFDSGYIAVGSTVENKSSDFSIVKFAFIPVINTEQSHTLSLVCDAARLDTIIIHNAGSQSLSVDSVSRFNKSSPFTLVSPVSFPQNIAPADSLSLVIRYGSATTAVDLASLNIFTNDTIPGHHPWPIALAGRKENLKAIINNAINDTFDFGIVQCGKAKDSSVTLVNTSTIPASFSLQTANGEFTIPVSNVRFNAAGERQPLDIHFIGDTTPGKYFGDIGIIDTCGKAHTITLMATTSTVSAVATNRAREPVLPLAPEIQSVYPNPATSTSMIRYATAQKGFVRLILSDQLGRVVQTLVQATMQSGVYKADIDTRLLMSGLYHLMLQSGSNIIQREMCIMR